MATNAPHHPDKLVGSRWTAVEVEDRRKHWDVVEFRKNSGEVVIRAVIDDHRRSIPWRTLRNREQWTPGWE